MRPIPAVTMLASIFGAMLLTSGCGDARGVMLTGDGHLVAATAEAYRSETERQVRETVRPLVPDDVGVVVHIDELPQYAQSRREPVEGWHWRTMHASVALVARSADVRDQDDRIAAAARRALAGKVPASRLTVAVDRHVGDAAVVTGPVANAPAVAPASAPPTARAYVAHAGDTLAELSVAFYGTADNWRLIRDANPGVDFATLRGGERLTIPTPTR